MRNLKHWFLMAFSPSYRRWKRMMKEMKIRAEIHHSFNLDMHSVIERLVNDEKNL